MLDTQSPEDKIHKISLRVDAAYGLAVLVHNSLPQGSRRNRLDGIVDMLEEVLYELNDILTNPE